MLDLISRSKVPKIRIHHYKPSCSDVQLYIEIKNQTL